MYYEAQCLIRPIEYEYHTTRDLEQYRLKKLELILDDEALKHVLDIPIKEITCKNR